MEERIQFITELKKWLKQGQSYEPIINGCERINDPKRFFETHIAIIEAHNEREWFVIPYYLRLKKVYESITR